ncbi:MAG TPA: hypothetical protein VEC12_11450, partial [Bacteroidia bacterium]|nr:hypothetical protein [Bacteroidia bacterium]
MTVQGIEAAQPSQSLSAIRELITGNLSNGDFHFSAQDFSSVAIKQMLTRFFGTDSLLFNSYNLQADTPDEYRLSANLQNQFLNTSNLQVVLSFTRDTDNVQLKATFSQYPLKWKLSTAFSVLQNSLADEFLYSEAAFTLDSQKAEVLPEDFPRQLGFPADPNMGDEVVVTGLSFSAQVSVIPENTALDWLLFGAGISTVKIEGPISLVNSKPVFWFVSAGGKTFDVLGQSLPLSLELAAVYSAQPAAPENYKVLGRISAVASYKLKSGDHSITVAAKFDRLDSALLLLEANMQDSGIELGIEDVTTVLGLENPGSFIPDDFPLATLKLVNIGATLLTSDKKIQQAYITIGNDTTWQPFGEWLSFNGFKIRFSTGFTAATTNVAAFSTANVLGTSIDSYIELPSLSFGLALSPGSSIEIGHMLSDMAISVPGLMNTTCTVFSLTGNIKGGSYSVMCQLTDVWQLTAGGMSLNLNEVSLRLTRSSMGNGAYLEAQAQIGQTAFQLMANHFEGTNYWQFQGNTLPGSTIPLQQIATDVGSLFGAGVDFPVDNLQLTSAKVNFDTRGNFLLYADAGVQVTLPFAQNSVAVKTIVNLNATIQQATNKRLYTGYFEGDVTIGKAVFTIRFDMGTAKTISGTWHNLGGDTTISLKDITDLVGLENVVQVPSSLDLSLTAAGLFYDITNQQFTLAAASLKYGTAFFTAGKDSNKSWGFVFGVTLTGFNKLSDIPGIGSYLTATDFITFEQMSVMVCSGTFNNYVVPKLPSIPAEAVLPRSLAPAATTTATPVSGQASLNIAPGVSLAAIMDLKTTGSGNVVFKNLNSVVNQAKLVTQASFGSNGVSLFVGLDGGAGIPDGKGNSLQLKKAGLQITLGDIMVVQLIGAMDFAFNGNTIEATSRLIISETQAQAAISVESDTSILPLPPGLKGIKLKDFGMIMGVFFEPPGLDVGMQGKVQIGDDALKDDSFAFVLEMIEEVPNPLYLSFYLDEIDLGKALQVFTDINDSKLVSALSVVKATNVSFYWCENIVVLPDGTIAQPGLGFSGMINVFGFGFMGEFLATVATGIHGKAQVAPVNIKDVLKLSGDGKTITRNAGKDSQTVSNTGIVRTDTPVQQQVMVAGGGPVFTVSTSSSPFLHLDFKASLFDVVNTAVAATIDSKGISFSLEFDVANIEKFNLTCTLTNWTNFKGNATFRFGIDETIGPIKILGINAGSVHLQVNASVDLGVVLNSDVFSLALDASFGFMGSTLKVPHIAISVAPKSLAQLPGVIVKEIKDAASSLFGYLFENAEKWAKYIGQGIITGVEDMAAVLKDAYKVAAEEAAR